MSEMVERVARAIDPFAFGIMDERGVSDERRAKAREKARAAIAAMRDPTDAMTTAGVQTVFERERSIIDGWRAMLDEALRA